MHKTVCCNHSWATQAILKLALNILTAQKLKKEIERIKGNQSFTSSLNLYLVVQKKNNYFEGKIGSFEYLWLKMEQEKNFKGTLFCHCLASSVSDPHGIILYSRKTVVFTLSTCSNIPILLIFCFHWCKKERKNKRGGKNNYSHLKLYQQGTNN